MERTESDRAKSPESSFRTFSGRRNVCRRSEKTAGSSRVSRTRSGRFFCMVCFTFASLRYRSRLSSFFPRRGNATVLPSSKVNARFVFENGQLSPHMALTLRRFCRRRTRSPGVTGKQRPIDQTGRPRGRLPLAPSSQVSFARSRRLRRRHRQRGAGLLPAGGVHKQQRCRPGERRLLRGIPRRGPGGFHREATPQRHRREQEGARVRFSPISLICVY